MSDRISTRVRLSVDLRHDAVVTPDELHGMAIDALIQVCHVENDNGITVLDGRADCRYCGRSIAQIDGAWVDPEAPLDTDDRIWRETCDANRSFTAEHEPVEPGTLFLVEADTRHYTWRAAGTTEAQARERLRQAYLAESDDDAAGAATLADEANVYQLSAGVALRDDHRIPE